MEPLPDPASLIASANRISQPSAIGAIIDQIK